MILSNSIQFHLFPAKGLDRLRRFDTRLIGSVFAKILQEVLNLFLINSQMVKNL
jgi:hypothetical protein